MLTSTARVVRGALVTQGLPDPGSWFVFTLFEVVRRPIGAVTAPVPGNAAAGFAKWHVDLHRRIAQGGGADRDESFDSLDFASAQCGWPHRIDDDQEKNGPKKGNEQACCAEVALIDSRHADQRGQEPSGKGRANDPDHDVEGNALARSHNRACCPTDQSADHEPENDVHK